MDAGNRAGQTTTVGRRSAGRFKSSGVYPSRQNLFATLFQSLPEGVVIFEEASGGCVYANRAARHLLPSLARSGKRSIEEGLRFVLSRALQYPGAPSRSWVRRPDGSRVSVCCAAIRDEAPERPILGHIAVLSRGYEGDGSEVETLRRSSASLRRALAAGCHDLGTPLGALMLDLEVASRIARDAEDERLKRILLRMENGVRRIAAVSQRLQEELKSSCSRELAVPVNLVAFIGSVAARIRAEYDLPASMVRIAGEEALSGFWSGDLLEQIVANLLSNAIKYGGGQPIDVFAARSGDCAELTVRDYGRGISAEDQRRLFERSFRGSNAKGIAGLGLGLFIVCECAKELGGTVRVSSSLGQGASFVVRLPIPSLPVAAPVIAS